MRLMSYDRRIENGMQGFWTGEKLVLLSCVFEAIFFPSGVFCLRRPPFFVRTKKGGKEKRSLKRRGGLNFFQWQIGTMAVRDPGVLKWQRC